MIKILLFESRLSDVTEMSVKGWKITIDRDKAHDQSFITVEKNGIKFTIDSTQSDDWIVLKKYYCNTCVDTKKYQTDGCRNAEGILFICDSADEKKTYAFWRNQELQILLESAGIERVSFKKDADETFDMTVYDSHDQLGAYTFKTDGALSTVIETEYSTMKDMTKVVGATYVYLMESNKLILSQHYDLEAMAQGLL